MGVAVDQTCGTGVDAGTAPQECRNTSTASSWVSTARKVVVDGVLGVVVVNEAVVVGVVPLTDGLTGREEQRHTEDGQGRQDTEDREYLVCSSRCCHPLEAIWLFVEPCGKGQC